MFTSIIIWIIFWITNLHYAFLPVTLLVTFTGGASSHRKTAYVDGDIMIGALVRFLSFLREKIDQPRMAEKTCPVNHCSMARRIIENLSRRRACNLTNLKLTFCKHSTNEFRDCF